MAAYSWRPFGRRRWRWQPDVWRWRLIWWSLAGAMVALKWWLG